MLARRQSGFAEVKTGGHALIPVAGTAWRLRQVLALAWKC